MYKLYWFVFGGLMIRQVCDCLDGAVARQCKKTSKIGGFLDNLADNICMFSLFFIFISFLFPKKNLRVFLFSSIIIITYLITNALVYHTNYLFDHSYIKENPDTFYKKIVAFTANNSLLLVLLIALVYLFVVKMFYKGL
jgi:phosphatidylglycerophosphate synthase